MKKVVSDTYTLAYLVNHPKTKGIVLKHLLPLPHVDEEHLRHVDGTLREMHNYNMGGGIPYEVITALMKELDAIHMPLLDIDEV